MKAYVINLDSRPDRWDSVERQSDRLGLDVVRISAVSITDVDKDLECFVAPGVSATWKSHQQAMKVFLDTGDKYGLILEDDFLLASAWDKLNLVLPENLQADFLQIGFLITSPLDACRYLLDELWDLSIKTLHVFSHISILGKQSFFQRLLIQEQSGVPWAVIPNNIRAGGHSYFVSRKFALASTKMNTPVFNTTDGYYISLGDVRTFRMFRTRRNYIRQSNSSSSVTQRFLNPYSKEES